MYDINALVNENKMLKESQGVPTVSVQNVQDRISKNLY